VTDCNRSDASSGLIRMTPPRFLMGQGQEEQNTLTSTEMWNPTGVTKIQSFVVSKMNEYAKFLNCNISVAFT
jgi:hypothetical protein